MSSDKRVVKDFWLCIAEHHFNEFVEMYQREGIDYHVVTSEYIPYIVYTNWKTGCALLKANSVTGQFFVRRDAVYKQTT